MDIYKILIDCYGGVSGLRDPGVLESAIFRPQSGYYIDTTQEASALWESLVINHPFLDGNKRVGFAAMITFLRINGYAIIARPEEIYTWVMALLVDNRFSFENIEIFLKKLAKPPEAH